MPSDRCSLPAKVLVYSDDLLLLTGAAAILSRSGLFDVALAQSDLALLSPTAAAMKPEIVLVDVAPDMTMGLFSAIHDAAPNARLVLWGRRFSDEIIEQADALSIAGYLTRGCDSETFLAQMASIAAGKRIIPELSEPEHATRIDLTPREGQLVTLLAQGLRNKEIANCLNITEGTVRIYLSKLFEKTGARDRFELAVLGLKNSLCGHAFWDGHGAFVSEQDDHRARHVLRSLVMIEPKRKSGYVEQAAAGNQG